MIRFIFFLVLTPTTLSSQGIQSDILSVNYANYTSASMKSIGGTSPSHTSIQSQAITSRLSLPITLYRKKGNKTVPSGICAYNFLEYSNINLGIEHTSWTDNTLGLKKNNLKDFNYGLGLQYQDNRSGWGGGAIFKPGVSSDFATGQKVPSLLVRGAILISKSLRITQTNNLFIRNNPLLIGFGLTYSGAFGKPIILPTINFRMRWHPYWSISTMFPLRAELTFLPNINSSISLRYRYDLAQYSFGSTHNQNFETPQSLRVSDISLGVGASQRLVKTLYITAFAGYIFSSNMQFPNSEGYIIQKTSTSNRLVWNIGISFRLKDRETLQQEKLMKIKEEEIKERNKEYFKPTDIIYVGDITRGGGYTQTIKHSERWFKKSIRITNKIMAKETAKKADITSMYLKKTTKEQRKAKRVNRLRANEYGFSSLYH